MLRLEVRNSETPIERKPSWIKTRLRTGPEFTMRYNLYRSALFVLRGVTSEEKQTHRDCPSYDDNINPCAAAR